MERAGRAGGKSVTGASSPSSYQASSAWPARTTALHQASRHIERRTPWSYLDRSQTSPVQHQAPVFTHLSVQPRGAGLDVDVADALVQQMPVERCPEFLPVVSLDPLDRERQL